MLNCRCLRFWLAGILLATSVAAQTTTATASVTILSSNLADGATVGEWGLSPMR